MNLKYFSDPSDAENFEPFPIVFSRGSVAYEGNGASLQTNQPSFIEGSKGVYGLGVYEQYSNLLTANQSKPTNITDFSGWQGDISYDTSDESVKFIPTDILDSKLNISNQVVLPSSKYTMSVYIKTNKTAGTIKIAGGITKSDFTYLGGVASIDYSAADFINGGWIHFTFDTTADVGRYYPIIWWLNPGANAQLKYYRGQLLNKPYASPWVLGGTTRQPDQAHIPVEEVKKFLNLKEGCIESLVYVNNVLSTTPLSENKALFGQGTGGNNGTLLIWKEMNNSSYTLEINGGTGNWVSVDPNPSINGLMTPFTIMWNSLKAGLMINSQFSEGSLTSFPQIYSTFRIGSRETDWFMSSHIPQLVFSKYRTREEIANRQKFAQANGYYPIDDKVTAFLDLESGLRAYRRTTQ